MDKKNKWNITGIKDILKSISIDKWLLMGAAGIVLILCSDSCHSGEGVNVNGKDGDNKVVEEKTNEDQYIEKMESKLEEILSTVDGAGKVNVMITLEKYTTKEVLKETPYTENTLQEEDGSGGKRDEKQISKGETVIYEELEGGVTSPFVISEVTPRVEGVAVVASGGDSPIVKDKITSIIKALFDIEINKIAVGKMK